MSDFMVPRCGHCGLPFASVDSNETCPKLCNCRDGFDADAKADSEAVLKLNLFLQENGLRGLDKSATVAAQMAIARLREELEVMTAAASHHLEERRKEELSFRNRLQEAESRAELLREALRAECSICSHRPQNGPCYHKLCPFSKFRDALAAAKKCQHEWVQSGGAGQPFCARCGILQESAEKPDVR